MAVWSSRIVAPHGSPSGVVVTRAILSHAKLLARLPHQHVGASRSFASILSPGFMSFTVSLFGLVLVRTAVGVTDGDSPGILVDGVT
jgi:hypothetical protein